MKDSEKILNEFEHGIIKVAFSDEVYIDLWEKCDIKTFEEEYNFIETAIKKQIPKKVNTQHRGNYINFNCPICGKFMGVKFINGVLKFLKYCPDCGQALDWSEQDDGTKRSKSRGL